MIEKFIAWRNRVLVWLGLRVEVRVARPQQDDRALEVYVWIMENPTKKHIVATKLIKTGRIFEALRDKGYDIEVYTAARIATGIFWTAPNMALSCTFIMRDLKQYEQLRYRLRGPNPVYNVVAASTAPPQRLR